MFECKTHAIFVVDWALYSQAVFVHLGPGDRYLVANNHTWCSWNDPSSFGKTPHERFAVKAKCMSKVLAASAACAASLGQQPRAHVVAAGHWNIDASDMHEVLRERPGGHTWQTLGIYRKSDFVLSTCPMQAGTVTPNKMYDGMTVEVYPPTLNMILWGNRRSMVKTTPQEVVERSSIKRGTWHVDKTVQFALWEDDGAHNEIKAHRQRRVDQGAEAATPGPRTRRQAYAQQGQSNPRKNEAPDMDEDLRPEDEDRRQEADAEAEEELF